MIILRDLILAAMQLYLFMCIIYIFMSWFPNARETSFGRLIGRLVEPYLAPFRQFIPPIGMIDISPIVALLALNYATRGVRLLFDMLIY